MIQEKMYKTHRERSFCEEDFFEFIKKLQKEMDGLIIVEGTKDKKALKYWDIKQPIYCYNPPIFQFVENIINKTKKTTKIISLLDADPEGKRIHKALKQEFGRYGYQFSSRYWRKMQKFDITCVEGLNNAFFQHLHDKHEKRKISKQEQ